MDQALRHRAQCADVGEIFPRIPGNIATSTEES
jgi:chorismate synthase